jgi:hypothetical protein
MLDVLPNSRVGVFGWTKGFDRARGEDWGALKAHDFSDAVDQDAAVKGVGKEIRIDEWWCAGIGGLESDCAF